MIEGPKSWRTDGSKAHLLGGLAPFLPTWLLERVVGDESLLTEAAMESWRGSVLMIDVSGFTALTERYAARGAEGAERISRILNLYFGRLIDTITHHGGDVVSFAGDALLAVWRVGEDGRAAERRAALEASAGAVGVREEMIRVEVGPEVRLTLRSCVASGSLQALLLGGRLGRWESAMVGPPLARLGTLLGHCGPVGVAVDAPTWELLDGAATGEAIADGAYRIDGMEFDRPPVALRRPEPASDAARALRRWVPGVIMSRIAAGQSGWLGELRKVSVAFVGLPVDHDVVSPEGLAVLQEVMVTLQRCVYRFDGSINKITSDEKGATLVAVFGLPPLSHEDDPLRCVRSALRMARRLQGRVARLPIGIATGTVFCGVMGSASRCEYTVMGSAVNLAARLMANAADRILCCSQTVRSARQGLEFGPPLDLTLKGFDQPVRTREPTGKLRAVVRSNTQIVGRIAERELLSVQIQRLVREELSGTVMLSGEPGIGKSRLTEELIEHAGRLGVRVLDGTADSLEVNSPYHVWRNVLTALLGIDSQQAPARMREQALATLQGLGEETLERASLLNALLPLDLPDTDVTSRMVGAARAASTHELVARIVRAAAEERPLLLVLEDGHWFDSATWALLQVVAERVHPLLLVVVTRPLQRAEIDEYDWLCKRPTNTEIDLGQLHRKEILDLAAQRLGVRELPSAAAEVIVERSGGNPMFVEELAYALRDAGALRIEGTECRLAVADEELSRIELPGTLQGLIVSRFDRLGQTQQLVLKVASVIGRVFVENVVRDIYPVDGGGAAIPTILKELTHHDLIREEIETALRSYLFKHALTHEAVYGLLLFSQRRELHREVARWYESHHADTLEQHYALIALHYTRAQEWKPAAKYLDKAGGLALKRNSNREAVTLYGDLLHLVGEHSLGATDEQHTHWQLQLAEARFRLGDIEACQTHGHNALRLAGRPVPTSSLGQLLGILRGAATRWLLRVVPGLFEIDVIEERRKRLALTQILNRLTESAIYGEDALACLDRGLRELNVAEPSGPSPELGRAYAQMAVVLGTIPLRRLCRTWARRALEVGASGGDTVQYAHALSRVGVYEIYIADWGPAEGHQREALRIATELGDRRLREESMTVLGLALYYQGGVSAPRALWEEVGDSARFSGNGQILAWSHIADSSALIRLGRPEPARASLLEIADWIRSTGTRTEHILVHGMLALANLRAGDERAAREHADLALPLFTRRPPVAYWMQHAVAAVCQTYLSLWRMAINLRSDDIAVLRQRARRALLGLRWFALVFPLGRAHSLLWRGHYKWLLGRPGGARRLWRAAVAESERLGLRFEGALARRALGASRRGSERETLLDEAIATLAEIEAHDALGVARQQRESEAGPRP